MTGSSVFLRRFMAHAVNNKHVAKPFASLQLPPTLLLGPGPSNPPPRVLAAMSLNTVGHLHPSYLRVMDEVQSLLRYAFQTDNKTTYAIAGSGAACMEATIVNLLEPGETVLVACNGYWGDRLTNVAERLGVKVHRVEGEWGAAIAAEELIKEIERLKPNAVFVTHGESSTGVCQPLDGIGEVCQKNNSLFIVDTVVTLGGMPFFADDWKVDVVYSGAQKCLSCPPGVSPISFGSRAVEKISSRKTPVASFYLDSLELSKYWGQERVYHHTGSINSTYALRESLVLLSEKGLENSWAQHEKVANSLFKGLEDIGLELLVKNPKERLLPVTTVKIPKGVDGKSIQGFLMNNYNIEIAGGLGKLAGKVWRIGLMGHNARYENVELVLTALKAALSQVKQ
eukprot:TRINITY_DN13179_c0_g1_i1.p1 TRINITY_DN13179_c0_g1~~TRINITY_DN13179_c0_g1_i1.p1  ORF type:complete len:397 (-),score=64.74 TRINITY_DN13179_c0_g1_i1:68-1258(-)